MNDPSTYKYGESFRLVIDYCDEDLAGCIGDEAKREAYLNQVSVQSKTILQYFNKDDFKETGRLTYASAENMISGLIPK